MPRLRVGVLFGGRSGEHEVSLASAYAVMQALDGAGFEVIPIGIDKGGRWLVGGEAWPQLRATAKVAIGPGEETRPVPRGTLPVPLGGSAVEPVGGGGFVASQGEWLRGLDVIFPVLHGPYGEDGTVQGLLDLLDAPYVGCGVAGSAVCMDKILCKRVLGAAAVPQADYVEVLRSVWERRPDEVRRRVDRLGYPCFVKPANLGSSVGISKVHHAGELDAALDEAARYDRRLLVEEGIEDAHEIEISVLGNDEPVVSVPGEIVPCHEFYDYDAKYLAGESRELIPAPLPPEVTRAIQDAAVKAFVALDCAGMARIDFLVTRGEHRIYLNEVNTIPGFTPISMYPKLWAATGIPFADLCRRLIELALERHADRGRNETSI
ncbi:MAG: D-alanine--D-alanine ligase [Fimbriimonadaceae bacterium]|nr:D-alanine--D-alanine ligase [Fimbriimonadaceae bacterium]